MMTACRFASFAFLLATLVIAIGCAKAPDPAPVAPPDNAPAPQPGPPKQPGTSGQAWSPPKPPAPTEADKARFESLKKKGIKVEEASFGPGYMVSFPGSATDDDIKSIGGLKPVTSILFRAGHNITDTGIRELNDLEFLNSLTLDDCSKLTDAAFTNIERFPNLTSLALIGNSFGDAALGEIAKLTHLTRLRLANSPKATSATMTDAGMVHVGKLTALKSLTLHEDAITDEGLKAFKGLRELTHLSLAGTKITDAGLDVLDCPKLDDLGLHKTAITDAGVAKFSKLFPSLKELNLIDCPITDKCLMSLKGCPKLQTVNALRTKVTKAGVAEFQKEKPGVNIITD